MTSTRRYRSETREARAQATRLRVIEAAVSLFVEHGYGGTTIRAIAARAKVSVPTVELLFGKKSTVLKTAIDIARAGDDEPVAMLDRPDVLAAAKRRSVSELLEAVASVVGPAQQRSAGLVLAAFEGASIEPELQNLVDQLVQQRAATAAWIVERIGALAPLCCSHDEATDTVWLLLDPALFDRATRYRSWDIDRYQRWIATALDQLLLDDTPREPVRHRRHRTPGRNQP